MFTADNQARARRFVETCYNSGNLAFDDWLYHFSQKWPLSGDHLSRKIMA
jgi:hypothetical protein